jgi:hypothetical protein
MDSDPLDDTEIGEEINQAEEDANAPPPETIIVKRGRPAGSKNKAKAVSEYNPTIVSESQPLAPIPMASQPDPMYTALMKRLDAMDGMLAQRQAEIVKKEKAPPKPRKAIVERDISPPSPEPAPKEEFRIQGSPRTASRQLMEHLHQQQMERASARERMYQNFLPI